MELPRGTKDADVVRFASVLGAVVVTYNRRDFEKLVGRVSKHSTHHANRKAAGAIFLECPKPIAEQRVRRVMSTLIAEAVNADRREDRRMFVRVKPTEVTIIW